MKTLSLMLTTLLTGLLLCFPAAADRGERKQVFGDYEVHYIGLTTSFLDAETAAAYDIPRSRKMGFLSISVLKKGAELPVPVKAEITGTRKNLIGQINNIELREITEQDAIYYISNFRFDEEEVYRIALKVTPEGQTRTFDVNFSQQFYEE